MKWLALAFAVAAGVVIIASAAILMLSLVARNACDTRVDEKRFDPLRHDLWARTSSSVCTGFGGSAGASVEVGKGEKGERETVFIQYDGTPPRIGWSSSGSLEIHVDSTETIPKSDVFAEGVGIIYLIPKSSSKASLERERADLKARMKPLVLAGKVDISGGDVQGNLRNLDEIASRSQVDIDRFVRWSERVHARVE